MGFFDEFLNDTVTDKADRDIMAGLAKKYPGIEQGVTNKREAKALEGELGKWNSWRDAQWDVDRNMTRSEAEKADLLAATQQRISELEATQGADMTFEEMEKGLGEKGYLTEAKLKAAGLITAVESEKRLSDGLGNQAAAFEHVYARVTPKMFDYKDEFGENMPLGEFYKRVSTVEGIKDIDKTYEDFVAPKRLEQQLAKANLDLEAVKLETETLKTKAIESSKSPVDNGQSSMGHLQKRMQQEEAKAAGAGTGMEAAMEGQKLGSGGIAALYAQQYREKTAA